MVLLAGEFSSSVTFAPRNPPDRSDGRQVLVAGQHQPDGLLPGELRPPELEAAHPAAPQQPPGASLGPPVRLFLLRFLVLLPLDFPSLCLSDHLCGEPGRTHRRRLQPGQVRLLLGILPKLWLKVQSNKTAD